MSHETPGRPLFHLAIPVKDLEAASAFYEGVLACPRGRSSERWIDYDFFGHQLVVHLCDDDAGSSTNAVENEQTPVRHFGVLLERAAWEAMVKKFEAASVEFLIEPMLRYKGAPGEQRVFFVRDPSGNALEFKSMTHPENVFAA